MNYLWAPWRIAYILGPKSDDCVFCLGTDCSEDEKRLVLHRGQYCFVILNRFPYNSGHLMICPYRHVSLLESLAGPELLEMMELAQLSSVILKNAFKCEGINMGLNQGQAAGAGIRDHLHFHLVPRWNGDSSFIAVLDDVRTIPAYLEKTYIQLLPYFQRSASQPYQRPDIL